MAARSPEKLLWRAYFSVEPGEGAALQEAASTMLPVEDFMLMTELLGGADDHDAEFAFTVAGNDEAGGEEEARRMMYRVRRQALLDPNESTLRVLVPAGLRRDQRPLAKAETLLELGRYEEAVVFAQVACETRASAVIRDLLASVAPAWLVTEAAGRATNLTDSRSQRIFHQVTGRKVQEEPWWPDYREHVQRRHRVIHDAAAVNGEDGRASVQVSFRLITFLDAALDALQAAAPEDS